MSKVKSAGFDFFKNLVNLFIKNSVEESFELNSSNIQHSLKPFFTTRFSNTFILGIYGFYFRSLPVDNIIVTTARLRRYLHSLYSFVDPLPLKKNILKRFLLKKEY